MKKSAIEELFTDDEDDVTVTKIDNINTTNACTFSDTTI